MASDYDITLTRTLDAPREKVWQAWTDPVAIQQWWGPKGVTNPTCEWEARPGGTINIVMLAGPELGELAGQEWPMSGEMREVQAPERLVFTGNAIMDGKPVLENLVTVLFEVDGAKTKLTVRVEITMQTPEAAGPLAGMEQGWNQQLDKLSDFVRD